MSVGVLIITHSNIGEQLVKTAGLMLGGEIPLAYKTLSIAQSCEPAELTAEANSIVEALDQGAGVLVLTDIFGSTPSNIANSIDAHKQLKVIAGVNLPMLIRVLNYPNLKLEELVEKALSGGHDGIMLCEDR